MEKNIILDENQIKEKIRRIAFQLYEDNFQENEVVFAGIQGSGYGFAQKLLEEFQLVAAIPAHLVRVRLDKLQPVQSDVALDWEISQLANKVIILVDDVLYTGRTLSYCLKPFLEVRIKKLRTVVLVDRKYKKFPVSADYVGYSLSTTLSEHIEVVLDENQEWRVYLS